MIDVGETHNFGLIDIVEDLRNPHENPAADYQVSWQTRDRPTVSERHWNSYIHDGKVTKGIHLRKHVVLSSLIPTTRPVKALHCQLFDPEVPGQVKDGRGYARLRQTKVVNPSGISTLDLMNAGATWHGTHLCIPTSKMTDGLQLIYHLELVSVTKRTLWV